jgi:hypothetical protein
MKLLKDISKRSLIFLIRIGGGDIPLPLEDLLSWEMYFLGSVGRSWRDEEGLPSQEMVAFTNLPRSRQPIIGWMEIILLSQSNPSINRISLLFGGFYG